MTDVTDDIAADQRAANRKLRDEATQLESLVTHPGWKIYLTLIEAVGQNYHKALMEPLNNSFECVKAEFAKGALTGLSLAAQITSAKLREAQELTTTTDSDEE